MSTESPKFPEIPGYTFEKRLGKGGMASVYLAIQENFQRPVAIKIMAFSDDLLARERFRREADSAAKLQHANVIPVFEVGQSPDVIYYSMQLIEGPTLSEVIAEMRGEQHTGGGEGL